MDHKDGVEKFHENEKRNQVL